MSFLHIDKMDAIKDFPNKSDQLAIMNRHMPENADLFFTELLKISFNITGKINKETATINIKDLLSDKVPIRMLVTYAGQGTEWLPDNFADKIAYKNGEPNEKIIKDISAKQFIGEWDIAVFKGGPEGLLHRTPDSALNKNSILMRLDHPEFWKNIQRNFK